MLTRACTVMSALLLVAAAAPAAHARAAGELPLGDIKLPPGFHIALYATGLRDARSLALGPDGIVFVGTREAGNVYAIVPNGGRPPAPPPPPHPPRPPHPHR